MNRRIPFFIFWLALFCSVTLSGFAQDPAPEPVPQPPPPVEKTQAEDQASADPCPKISLKAPNQPVRDGVLLRLSAGLVGGDKKVSPIFDWSLSAGVIRSGQGTPNIEIDTTGAGSDRAIQATLLIGGFSAECSSSESVVVPISGPAQKADEFEKLPETELASRIESFISSVNPSDSIHIIAYAGRTDPRGYASSSLKQMRALALKSGIQIDRLVTADGGYRENASFEFWIVPFGSDPPKPSPTISAKDIVFPKTTPTARNKP